MIHLNKCIVIKAGKTHPDKGGDTDKFKKQ